MAYLNRVFLLGNLGRAPEVRVFPSGGKIATTSLATTKHFKDRQTKEKKEFTEWHNLVFREGLAETAEKYLKVGAPLFVEGELRTRKWTDQGGITRYVTEVHVANMQMIDYKRPADDAGNEPSKNATPSESISPTQKTAGYMDSFNPDDPENDIPF